MNIIEREKMVRAMEFICRNINDEIVLEGWFVNGVADEDISYGDVCPSGDSSLEYYLDDDNFADLMDTFLWCMTRAKKSGGLYCDNVLSEAH